MFGTYTRELSLLSSIVSTCNLVVLGLEVIDGHRGLRDSADRCDPTVGLLLRQRRGQVDLHEGSDIRYEREAGRLAITSALLGPRGNLVGGIADLCILGVAESLTAATVWVSPNLTFVAAGTDVARSLIGLIDQSSACKDEGSVG